MEYVYQSFSASYNIEQMPVSCCGCDYCMNHKFESNKQLKCVKFRSKSLDSVNRREDSRNETQTTTSSYYSLWQGEMFKAKAFEKQNEKLERRVKWLENKLDKETQQQIRISLEWRKTVIRLADENKRLKLLVEAYEANQIK